MLLQKQNLYSHQIAILLTEELQERADDLKWELQEMSHMEQLICSTTYGKKPRKCSASLHINQAPTCYSLISFKIMCFLDARNDKN